MPEGPEVKRNAVELSKSISGKELTGVNVVSGRYTRNDLVGLTEFRDDIPSKVTGVGCHGKFLFVIFANGFSLWSTFGMTGRWSSQSNKHTRLSLGFSDGLKVYFNDIRNFGTAKFVYGPTKLIEKLKSLGLDLLSSDTTPGEFLEKLRQKNSQNICKVIMNQSVLAGVGNYVKAESLWSAEMDPRKKVEDFEDFQLLHLKDCIEKVLRTSYETGGATFLTHENFSGSKGNYSERFLCYNRKIDFNGNVVEKIKTPDGRTTHWSPNKQR